MSFQDYNLCHHVVCIHRYWSLNLLLINALYLKKKKKSCWHLLYAGSLNIHQALERCWTIQSHPDEGKPSALDCLNTMRLHRSWRVNRCRDQFTTYKLFYSSGKCKTVVSQVLINCIVPDPHIECSLGSPKHRAEHIGTNIIIRLCYIANYQDLMLRRAYWKWITENVKRVTLT